MKNLLLVLFGVVVFMGCSKDDKGDKREIIALHFEMCYDTDGKGPEGNIFLFWLNGQHLAEEIHPTFFEHEGKDMCAITDVNGEYVYQTYKRNFSPSKDSETGKYKNISNALIHLTEGENDFGLEEGISLKGEYLVIIKLESSPYSYTFNQFMVNDIIKIKHTFKRDSEDYNKFEKWQ